MMHDPVTHRLADLLSAEPAQVLKALEGLGARIRLDLERDGESVVDGIGTFRDDENGITLEPEPQLRRFFNRPYESLKPVIVQAHDGDSAYQKTDIIASLEADEIPLDDEGSGIDVVPPVDSEPMEEPEDVAPVEDETDPIETPEAVAGTAPGDVTDEEEPRDALEQTDTIEQIEEPVEPPEEHESAVSTRNGTPPVEAGPDGEPVDPEEIPKPSRERDVSIDEEPRRRPVWIPILLLLVAASVAVYLLTRPADLPPAVEQPVTEQPAPDPGPADEPAATDLTPPVEEPAGAPRPDAAFDPLYGSTIEVDRGGYTWIYASLPDRAAAEAVAERFRGEGFRTGVMAETAQNRTFFRVGLGQFESSEAAVAASDQLPPLPANTPGNPWLRRIN